MALKKPVSYIKKGDAWLAIMKYDSEATDQDAIDRVAKDHGLDPKTAVPKIPGNPGHDVEVMVELEAAAIAKPEEPFNPNAAILAARDGVNKLYGFPATSIEAPKTYTPTDYSLLLAPTPKKK